MKISIDVIRHSRSIHDITQVVDALRKEANVYQNILRSLSKRSSNTSKSASDEIKLRQQGGSIKAITHKLKEFKAPVPTHIVKYDNLIKNLHTNSVQLEAAIALIEHGFEGLKKQPKALESAKALQVEVKDYLEKALSGLAEVADSTIPPEIRYLSSKLADFLMATIEESDYKDAFTNTYLTVADDNRWMFSTYVTMTELKNEQGYVFPEYNVILTSFVDEDNNVEYFINAVPEFHIPGKYLLGSKFTSEKSMKQKILILLKHVDLLDVLDHKPMPLEKSDVGRGSALRKIPGVASTHLEEDRLMIILKSKKPTDDEFNEVLKKAIPLVRALLGKAAKNYSLQHRKDRNAIVFRLTQAMSKDAHFAMDLHKLDEVSEALGIPDEERDHLKTFLKRRGS